MRPLEVGRGQWWVAVERRSVVEGREEAFVSVVWQPSSVTCEVKSSMNVVTNIC